MAPRNVPLKHFHSYPKTSRKIWQVYISTEPSRKTQTNNRSTEDTNFLQLHSPKYNMSMVPLLFRDWWDDMDMPRPSRLLDQHFGIGLRRDDLFNSLTLPTSSLLRGSGYYRPWRNNLTRQDSGSTISADKDKFQVILDVQQFTPNEITVKISQNSIVVEGKHEEKQDEHGYVSRHFVRRYVLPREHDTNDVVSTLSSDGILTITAPKKQIQAGGERVVPITQTGPAKATSPQPTIEQPN